MSSKQSTQNKKQSFIDIDDSSVKDLKFCICSFFAILIILFHYAWIMRQWVLNPLLPRSTISIYAATLIGTVVVTFGFLAKVVHPRIYSTAQGKDAQEKKNE